jgi:drug/metabolite transporter (DMT)-like permease
VTTTAAAPTDAPDTDLPRGLVGAAIAVTAWSAGTILAKDIDMGALAIGAYRFGFFFVVLLVWMAIRGTPFRLRVVRASAVGGIALGADIALFFSAVKETSIVNATIIGSLQPIVVGVVAARFFGEQIRSRDALWSLVALAGVFVIVTSGANDDVTSLRGDLLAAGAMLAWSTYFIASKESRKRLTPTEFTAGTSIWTAAICVVVGMIAGQDLSWPSAANWGWLIAMAIGSGVVGHALMNWSLVRIPLWVGSTFTLFIPVASALLAWVFLDEAISVTQAVAMAAVIGSLAMIVRGQTRSRATAPATAGAASPASAGSATPPDHAG